MIHTVTLNICCNTSEQQSQAFKNMVRYAAQEQENGFTAVNLSAYLHDREDDGREPGEEYFDEYTLFKVVNVFRDCDVDDGHAERIIEQFKRAGILFRERA